MFKYAQILNDKVHHVMEHQANITELYAKYFSSEIVFVDITGNLDVQEGWDYINGVIVEPLPIVIPLETLKTEKWASIKNARDTEEHSPLAYLDKLFDFDALSSERLAWAISAATTAKLASQVFTVNWTTYDNTVITMTADDILGLPIAVAVRSNAVHQKARGLRQEIEDAITTESLELINW